MRRVRHEHSNLWNKEKFRYTKSRAFLELSKGEFNSVMQAVGGVDAMIDPNCKDKDLLALVTYISADERAEKVMENQSVIRQPIVRNGRQATVGYAPDVWKTWQ